MYLCSLCALIHFPNQDAPIRFGKIEFWRQPPSFSIYDVPQFFSIYQIMLVRVVAHIYFEEKKR
jgi:hypothetical protein